MKKSEIRQIIKEEVLKEIKILYSTNKRKGSIDFRYENTLRISFDEPIKGEKETDSVNSKLYELLEKVSTGEDIELDWRDDSEVEIHNVDPDKFFGEYDDSFISLI